MTDPPEGGDGRGRAPSVDSAVADPDRLESLRSSGLLDTPPEPNFDRWTAFVRRGLGADVSLITLLDRDRQFFKSAAGLPEPWATERETALSHSFCKYVVAAGDVFRVADARQDPSLTDNHAVDELGVTAYLGVPLRSRNGHLLGAVSAIQHVPREWTSEEVRTLEDVAAAVTGEIELKRAGDRTYTVLSHMSDLVSVYAPDGTILYHSPSVKNIIGRPAEERLGENVLDVVHPADRPALEAARDEVLAHHEDTVSVTLRVSHAEGGYRILESRLSNLLDDPAVRGILSVSRDVTERERARERLQLFLASAPVALWTVDRDFRFTWVAGRAMADMEVAPNDLVGSTIYDLFGTNDPDSPPIAAYETALQGTNAEFEVEWGGRRWQVRLTPLVQEDRIEGVAGVAVDVTRTREIERRLEQQSARFRRLFEESPEAIILLDESDTILQVNPEFERLFGYPAAEAIGRSVGELIVPHGREAEARRLNESVALGERVEIEAMRMRRDGAEVPVSILATPVRIGDEVHIYGIYRDISERKELENRLLHSQRLEAVGQLAGGVAHDFNNILTVILGHLQVLLNREDLDTEIREDLAEIRRAGERAARLTGQLLTFSRRDTAEARPVDVNEVLGSSEQMLERLIEEHIQLDFDLEEALPLVAIDPAQLEQVVMNLVINARDATATGGRIRVGSRTRSAEEGDSRGTGKGVRVVLEVSDEGQGMTPEQQARMFEPFFTTKPAGEGTGLGLSTVYGIIDRAGGAIEVESDLGAGTTVRVLLPALDVERGERTEEEDRTGAPPGGRGELVLLVDDDHAVRKVTRRILERAGYRVVEAGSGEDALEVCDSAEIRPDLVLTDLVMPNVGGYELVERLRERHPEMPALLMTGYTEPPAEGEPPQAGLIRKPFDALSLVRRVQETLAAREGE